MPPRLLAWILAGWVAVVGADRLATAQQASPAPSGSQPPVVAPPSATRGSASTAEPEAPASADFAEGKWDELQAASQRDQQKLEQAVALYRAAAAAQPDSVFLQSQLSALLVRAGQDQEALAVAQSLVRQHPDSIEAHRGLASVYLRQLRAVQPPLETPAQQENLKAAIEEYQTLIRLEPQRAEDYASLGRLYSAAGQSAAAEGQFRQALKLDPSDVQASAELVQLLGNEGRLEDARAAIEALPQGSRTGVVYATLGEAYASRHLYSDAAAAFRQAVTAVPDEPAFQDELAEALVNAGQYEQALQAYQQLRVLVPDDGRAALRVAQMQMQMGQFSAAEQSLGAARKLLPHGDLELDYAGALLAESQGQSQQALIALRDLSARPSSPGTQSIFLDQLVRLELRTGAYAEAAASLQRLNQLGEPYARRARLLSIDLFTDQRDYSRALQVAREALTDRPQSRSLHVTYANLLGASGQTTAAIAELQPFLRGNHSDWDLHLAMSRFHMQVRAWPQALREADLSASLAATSAQRAQALSQTAAIDSQRRQYGAAEKVLRRALALDPGDPATLNALGYVMAQEGERLPQALGYVRQALATDAENGVYLDSLGWVYYRMNRIPEAVTSLERAAQEESYDPVVLDHLAQAYARDGQLEQAVSTWKRLLELVKLHPAPEWDAVQSQRVQDQLQQLERQLARQPQKSRR